MESTSKAIKRQLPIKQKWAPGQQALIRSVAHQIRSTLASVSIGAEALTTASAPSVQKVRRHAGGITEQVHHIGRLLEDLVAVSSDQLEQSDAGMVEVNEVIWEAAQRLWQLAKHRAIKLEVLPSSEPMVVRGKRSYLVQAVRGCLEYGLLNLPEDSQISIRVKGHSQQAAAAAVEILIEYDSSAQDSELTYGQPSSAWEGVTMLAVRRIVDVHRGDVAPLGNGHEGLRLLLPRHRAVGAKKMPWRIGDADQDSQQTSQAVA